MAGSLEGAKILEVSQYIAMPSAIAILSDWGAEVIKVESTAGGDGALRSGSYLSWYAGESGYCGHYACYCLVHWRLC